MFQERDAEKEILLGNKQLLGIFFVLAILFGVFFFAGYMVGHSKTAVTAKETGSDGAEGTKIASTTAEPASENGGETHAIAPDSGSAAIQSTSLLRQEQTEPAAKPLGSPHRETAAAKIPGKAKASRADAAPAELSRSDEEAQPAQTANGHRTYLQVAALGKTEAEAVAKVLSKKGFHAQIAPKPGSQYFRVWWDPYATPVN